MELDGNAIARTMMGIFGHEMTAEFGTCASCGTRSMVGEFRVYLRAPGEVDYHNYGDPWKEQRYWDD